MLWHQVIGFAIISLALTQLQSVNSQAAVTSCGKNFSLVADKCLLASNKWLNWYEADRHCRSLGAGLLSVQNQSQLQQISKWVNTTIPYTVEFWTSGNSLGQKGTYYWQTTGEQARYLPWATGQPKAADGDCLTLYTTISNWGIVGDYRLAVRNATLWAPIVCEQSAQKYSTRMCLKPDAYEMSQVLVN